MDSADRGQAQTVSTFLDFIKKLAEISVLLGALLILNRVELPLRILFRFWSIVRRLGAFTLSGASPLCSGDSRDGFLGGSYNRSRCSSHHRLP